LDSVVVRWPDGTKSRREGVAVNQRLTLQQPDAQPVRSGAGRVKAVSGGSEGGRPAPTRTGIAGKVGAAPFLQHVEASTWGLDWRHQENYHNDFNRQPLLFHMKSTEGPPLCVGDLNGDQRDDVYVGGARNQPGAVFRQNAQGRFDRVEQPALENDRIAEDTDCAWFDADGDGDLDLYVASGGSEFPASSTALMDRLYRNDGQGGLERSNQVLISASSGFEPTGAVAAADYDGDGDVDLFVGARMRPFAFGVPVDGHLLINDGRGRFAEATDSLASGLRELGLITDAQWADTDGDADLDLLVAGEWMPLTLFENRDGALINRTADVGLDATSGWWNAVRLADLDRDGDMDLVGANHGLNSRFHATPEEPVQMWVNDFDRNGTVEQVTARFENGKVYPMALRHDLVGQIRTLEEKYPTYESYAQATVRDIFSEEQLDQATHHRATQLQSVVGWNDGSGRFRMAPLPQEAQLAPMYGIEVADLDADGRMELLMGGNLYESKPEVGRYDASYGAVLRLSDSGFQSVPFDQSGLWVQGPVRGLETLQVGGQRVLVVARNNDALSTYIYSH
jgi:hypothetical protein